MFTIITIHKGDIKNLNKTLNSILIQKNKHFKTILVATGMSKNEKLYHKNKFNLSIFDKDKSIYNAMNIGLKNSNNSYVLFLNSGDELIHSNVTELIISEIKKLYNDQILCFPTILSLNNKYFVTPSSSNLFKLNKNCCHNSFVAPNKKKIYFLERNSIFNDGIWMNLLRSNYSTKIFNQPITNFVFDGISSLPTLKIALNEFKYSLKEGIKLLIKSIILKILDKNIYFLLIMKFNKNQKYRH